MTGSIDDTLIARRAIHGDFTDHAAVTQALKDVAHASPSWAKMTPVAREAVDMILHKVGRICAGDPNHADHWHDIAGYARLVEERLGQDAPPSRDVAPPRPFDPMGQYASQDRYSEAVRAAEAVARASKAQPAPQPQPEEV